MTQDFQDMIYLFACSARGIEPQISHKINVPNIHKLSMSQNIWPLVFLALKQLYDNNILEIDSSLFNKWKIDVMQTSVKNIRRNNNVYKTIKYLEENNIACCVLKGESVARLYHTPICRISNDTDILIDENDERMATKLLRNYGYTVEKRPPDLHHTNCFHPVAGHLELHVALYGYTTDDIFLNRKVEYKEEYIKIKCEDENVINSLGITDGLIFLMIHFIKHFIKNGAGIRQLMDILLYISNYKKEINWKRFDELMRYLKYDKIFNNILGIGEKYLLFKTDEFLPHNFDESVAERILTDIEEGGIFGHISPEKVDFYKLYIKERFNTFKTGDFIDYMNKHRKENFVMKIFPNRRAMLVNYRYLNKSPLLLPIAWTHRIINLIFNIIARKKTVNQYIKYTQTEVENKFVKKRMELIRELDMI
jgi:hypothetical protein